MLSIKINLKEIEEHTENQFEIIENFLVYFLKKNLISEN